VSCGWPVVPVSGELRPWREWHELTMARVVKAAMMQLLW